MQDPGAAMANETTATMQDAPGLAGTPDNRWDALGADGQGMPSGPVAARLDDHAVLEFEGQDAVAFLQSQSTADIAAMGSGDWQLGAYCTPKGRLLAIFQSWRYESGVRLLLPRTIAADVQRRLSMFVLRSKLRIRDVSDAWAVFGLCGAGCAQALIERGVDVPAQPGQCARIGEDERCARLPVGAQCAERVVLVVRAEGAAAWQARMDFAATVESGVWWWSSIDAGIPAIFASTRELFVPQAVNLEVLGAVSFRKGCYPGQEIVARSQYLGKLRRRMAIARADSIGPSADIFAAGSDAPVGRIVMAARVQPGSWDLLFECPTAQLESASLHAGSADAAPMQIGELPYRIFDPTA